MLDIEDIADVVAGAIREATTSLIERNAALEIRNTDLEARIIALESRQLPEAIPGEPGRDGADCDMEAVERMIEERIAALPAPQDGKDGRDIDIDEVRGLIAEQVASAVSALPPVAKGTDGKDGIGLADALIDKDGRLVLTMTDGRTKELGVVLGSDCEDGENGETFALDDFDIIPLDDGRSFKFCFTRGEVMHSFEFSFPVVLDRGVWSEKSEYAAGDAVSWGGSLWIAQKDAPGKPETADSGWRLAVKKGRDGKDAK